MSAGVAGSWSSLAEAVAERLVAASLWGGALALAVLAVCALAPGLPAVWRRWLWWAVALKLLLGLAPLPPVALPVLAPVPEPVTGAPALDGADRLASGPGWDAARVPPPPSALARPAARPAAAEPTSAPPERPAGVAGRLVLALVAAWALGAALSLLAAAGEALRAALLVRRAAPADAELERRFARLREALGTPRARLRLSREVETPQLTGIVRPTVLLPPRAAGGLDEPELEMALAHELVHVRQRDLLLGLVPALAARLFFFHPLARLAAREHALAREAVCDAAVVGRFAPSPRAYGRLLLRLSLPDRAPLRAAVAAATHQTLHRRLQMLLHPPRRTRAAWAWLAGACAVAVLVPFRLTAADAEAPAMSSSPPGLEGQAPPSALAATAAVAAEPPTVVPDVPRSTVPAPPSVGATEPEAAAEPAEPRPQIWAWNAAAQDEEREAEWEHEAERDEEREWEEERGWEEEWDREWERENDGRAFLLTHGSGHTMSGNRRDIERANRWRRDGEELLWFRRDGKEWVIRDPATLARVQALWEPQRELGEQQAALGSQQAELGEQQAALGRRQAELGGEQAELAARQAEVGAKLAALNARQAALGAREFRADDAERRELREQRRQLDAEREPLEDDMRELGGAVGELGRRQGELGREQGELGRQQGALGREQGELGREQGRLARLAERELWQVLDAAVASGVAQRVE